MSEDNQMTDEEKEVWHKLNVYYNFLGDKARKTLDQMPKTQETLDVIEEELEKYLEGVPGKTTKEKWFNLVRGLQTFRAMNEFGVNYRPPTKPKK